MEEITQNKQSRTMAIAYAISMLIFVACNLFQLNADDYGYFISVVLVVSLPLIIISSLLFWVTRLLMVKSEHKNPEERQTAYWTTYIFSHLFLIIPVLIYFNILIQNNGRFF